MLFRSYKISSRAFPDFSVFIGKLDGILDRHAKDRTPVAALDTCFSVLMQNDLSATEQEEFRIRCRSALDGLEMCIRDSLWLCT